MRGNFSLLITFKQYLFAHSTIFSLSLSLSCPYCPLFTLLYSLLGCVCLKRKEGGKEEQREKSRENRCFPSFGWAKKGKGNSHRGKR